MGGMRPDERLACIAALQDEGIFCHSADPDPLTTTLHGPIASFVSSFACSPQCSDERRDGGKIAAQLIMRTSMCSLAALPVSHLPRLPRLLCPAPV